MEGGGRGIGLKQALGLGWREMGEAHVGLALAENGKEHGEHDEDSDEEVD